jgi:hypothetical protein
MADLDAFDELQQVSTSAVNALRFQQRQVHRDPVCPAGGA